MDLNDRILLAIDSFSAREGYSPSLREIAQELDLPRSTVFDRLTKLRKSGLVSPGPRRGAGWRLVNA